MTKESKCKTLQDSFAKYQKNRDNLIPLLQLVQEEIGFISEESVARISEYLDMSQTEIYGVATFYTQFRFDKPGRHKVRVCLGTACHVRGAGQIMSAVTSDLGIKPGDTTDDFRISLERVACFGSCALAPIVVVDDTVHGRMTPEKTTELLKEIE